MLAQTPICPDPWAKAKVVYGQVTLKAQESRTANGETQTINQTGTAQFPLYRDTLGDLGSCGWAGGIGSPPASLTATVEHPCTTDTGQTQTVTDTWFSDNIISGFIKLQFVTSDTYKFGVRFDLGGTIT